MVAVKLEQYLASILASAKNDTNEVYLEPGNKNLDLLTIFLEKHNQNTHRYQATNAIMLYVAEGTARIKVNGQAFLVEAGNLVLLQNKSNYEIESQNSGDLLVKLVFNSNLTYQNLFAKLASGAEREQQAVEQVLTVLRAKGLLYLKSTRVSQPAQLLKKIIDEYLNQSLFASPMINAELTVLLAEALRNQSLTEAATSSYGFAQTAFDQYIEANFANITLAQAAQHFGFNTNYFSSLVKQKTGKSFVEHVDERRMEEARTLLARTDISVKEIIARIGYSGKSFFYRKFNDYYHETPMQMRAELFRQAKINLK
ncbi:helix-turn-helix transcriptional regulator [Lactobacillus xylocopicola]|uniref:AraC family transcriptional regulator n=1 Tax=Lactobacillus xylocopicola TaxID=2976676 RepID=A0ABN6SK88_9LACO|nr:AraC family transcriptional regulator [Lactobacillus xylocopicola]BDR59844.1 AraC family transcriptional regulator [Lactobacillus xylocopicola]